MFHDINGSIVLCLYRRVPFYYELKIAFVVWLLSPYTKGSSLLYRKFVHPTLSSKEKVKSLPALHLPLLPLLFFNADWRRGKYSTADLKLVDVCNCIFATVQRTEAPLCHLTSPVSRWRPFGRTAERKCRVVPPFCSPFSFSFMFESGNTLLRATAAI